MSDNRPIFLTGFGPFGNFQDNPSWLAVEEASLCWTRPERLVIQKVPVAYEYIQENIPLAWKELKPKLAVHVGVSGLEKDVIHLETCAHSSGYFRQDINGCCGPESLHIDCLNTKINVDDIVKSCSNTFPVVKSSKNAGRYLCEFIYYTSLHTGMGPVLFVHVPLLDDDVTVKILGDALIKIIECCLEQKTTTA